MKRDLIWLTVLAAVAFAILVSLGFWQLQRLAWKEGLIARIEARAHGVPISLSEAVSRWKKDGDIEYMRVRLKGRFRHDRERHLFSVIDGKTGWRIFTPIETTDRRIVLVDRGFVPDALKAANRRPEGQIDGLVEVVGLARESGRKGYFTPENEVKTNIWYWRDLKGMARSSIPQEDQSRLVPFFVELESQPVPGDWPKGGATRLELPNSHLQYALTWFGLAGGLLVVVAVYVIGRMRQSSVA